MRSSELLIHGLLAGILLVGCNSNNASGRGTGGGSGSTSTGTGGAAGTVSSGGAGPGGIQGSGGRPSGTGGATATGGRTSQLDAALPGTGGRIGMDGGLGMGGRADSGAKADVPVADARSLETAGVAGTGGNAGDGGGISTGTASPGCGQAKPGQVPASLDVGGTQRTFVLDVPPTYDPNTPMPIMFTFHGMGLTGSFFKTWSKLTTTFGASTFVVYPDALGDPSGWDSTGTQDVQFFDALVQLLTSTYCIDMKRIFVTGHSSGGYFTNALGCVRGDVIRGIAPQSGAGPINSKSCKGPMPAIIIHGKNDTSVKPEEGVKSRDFWAKADKCDTSNGTTSTINPVCFDYSGCQTGYPIVYCPYDGDHNLWTEAPKVIFDFFKGLSL
jgi:polyhydroxybutyrate depolymerase